MSAAHGDQVPEPEVELTWLYKNPFGDMESVRPLCWSLVPRFVVCVNTADKFLTIHESELEVAK